jgi:predicted PurR-regulated permease PerM
MRIIKITRATGIVILFLAGGGLLFFVFMLSPLSDSWMGYEQYNIANVVGITASIPVNKYNTLAQQLDEKEQALKAREKEIAEREIYIGALSYSSQIAQNKITVFGIGFSLLLFILISINFYLDWRRTK